METFTVTGAATRDYIAFRAETCAECAQLVNLWQSVFIPPESTHLCASQGRDGLTIELRVFVGQSKQATLDPATRDAIDTTP